MDAGIFASDDAQRRRLAFANVEVTRMSHDELVTAALELSHHERAALARRLLCSLEGAENDTSDLDEIWLEEAERRLGQVLSGQVVPVPTVDAMRQVRQALG